MAVGARLVALAACLVLIGLVGCEKGGGGGLGDGSDFGDNDPNLYVAVGDSITAQGWPGLLEAKLGSPVENRGVPGYTSGDGIGVVNSVLANRKPGFLLILFGANDIIHNLNDDETIDHLRYMINAAEANKTIPVLATCTPMYGSHGVFAGGVVYLDQRIRNLAAEENVTLVDLEAAFGSDESLISGDGLHPTGAGLEVIAQTFYAALQ